MAERLGQTTTALITKLAKEFLFASFQPYLSSTNGVSSNNFFKVVTKLSPPGCLKPNRELSDTLYEVCEMGPNAAISDPKSASLQGLNNLERLIFDTGTSVVTPFGFTKTIPSATHTGRPEVGTGPLESRNHQQLMDGHRYTSIDDIPLRFTTRKSRTALATPSAFNLSTIEQSARPPPYECVKDHIFGLQCNLHSGNALLPYPGSRGDKVVYAAAAVGIVHDLVTGKQCFFEEHDDDITCIAVAPGTIGLAATGQLGKSVDSRRRSIFCTAFHFLSFVVMIVIIVLPLWAVLLFLIVKCHDHDH